MQKKVTLDLQVNDADISKAGREALSKMTGLTKSMGEFVKVFKAMKGAIEDINGQSTPSTQSVSRMMQGAGRAKARRNNQEYASSQDKDEQTYRRPIMGQYDAARRSFEKGRLSLRNFTKISNLAAKSALVSEADEKSITERLHRAQIKRGAAIKSAREKRVRASALAQVREDRLEEKTTRRVLSVNQRVYRAGQSLERKRVQEAESNGQKNLRNNARLYQSQARDEAQSTKRILAVNQRVYREKKRAETALEKEYESSQRRSFSANQKRIQSSSRNRFSSRWAEFDGQVQRGEMTRADAMSHLSGSLSSLPDDDAKRAGIIRRINALKNKEIAEYEASARLSFTANQRRIKRDKDAARSTLREDSMSNSRQESARVKDAVKSGSMTRVDAASWHAGQKANVNLPRATRDRHAIDERRLLAPLPPPKVPKAPAGGTSGARTPSRQQQVSPYGIGEVGGLYAEGAAYAGSVVSKGMSAIGAFITRDESERMLRARFYEELGPKQSRDQKRLVFDKFVEGLEKSTHAGRRAIPIPLEELMGISEGGIASGIKIGENGAELRRFTEAVGRNSVVATGRNGGRVDSGELSTSFSRILGLTRMRSTGTERGAITGENAEVLGDLLVSLDEETKGTTEEIVKMTERISGFGSALNLTTEDVAGLGAMLVDVGIKSELGATALSQLFERVYKIAMNPKASPIDRNNLASITGIPVGALQGKMKQDPLAFYASMLPVLQKKSEEGKIFEVFEALGIKNRREELAFLQISGSKNAQNLLTRTRDFERGGVDRRLEIVNSTSSSEYKQFQNQLQGFQVQIGRDLFPILKENLTWMTAFAKWGSGIVSDFAKSGLGKEVLKTAAILAMVSSALSPTVQMAASVGQVVTLAKMGQAASAMNAASAATALASGAAVPVAAASASLVPTIVALLAVPAIIGVLAVVAAKIIAGVVQKSSDKFDADTSQDRPSLRGTHDEKMAGYRAIISDQSGLKDFYGDARRLSDKYRADSPKEDRTAAATALADRYKSLTDSQKTQLRIALPDLYKTMESGTIAYGGEGFQFRDKGFADRLGFAEQGVGLSIRTNVRARNAQVGRQALLIQSNESAKINLADGLARGKANRLKELLEKRSKVLRTNDLKATVEDFQTNLNYAEMPFGKLLEQQKESARPIGGLGAARDRILSVIRGKNQAQVSLDRESMMMDSGLSEDQKGKRIAARSARLASELEKAREDYNKQIRAAIASGLKKEKDAWRARDGVIARGYKQEAEKIRAMEVETEYLSTREKSASKRLKLEMTLLDLQAARIHKESDAELMLSKSAEESDQIRGRANVLLKGIARRRGEVRSKYQADGLDHEAEVQGVLQGVSVNDPVQDAIAEMYQAAMAIASARIRGATDEEMRLLLARARVATSVKTMATDGVRAQELEAGFSIQDDPREALSYYDRMGMGALRVNQFSTDPNQQRMKRDEEFQVRQQLVRAAGMKAGEVDFLSTAMSGQGYRDVAQRQRDSLLAPMTDAQRSEYLTSHLGGIGSAYGMTNEIGDASSVMLETVLRELKLDREAMKGGGFNAKQLSESQAESERLLSTYMARQIELFARMPGPQRPGAYKHLYEKSQGLIGDSGLTGDALVRLQTQSNQVKDAGNELDPMKRRLRGAEAQIADGIAGAGESFLTKMLSGNGSKGAMKQFWEEMVSVGNRSLSHLVMDTLKEKFAEMFKDLSGGMTQMLGYLAANLNNILGALAAMTGQKKSKLGVFGSILAFGVGAAVSIATGGTALPAILAAGSFASTAGNALADGDLGGAAQATASYYMGQKMSAGTAPKVTKSAGGAGGGGGVQITQIISDKGHADHYARGLATSMERLRVAGR